MISRSTGLRKSPAVFRWHIDTSDSRSLAATGLNHGTRVRPGFDKFINTVAEHSEVPGVNCIDMTKALKEKSRN